MDFDQLRTFLEVAKQGSFSRAGQKVFRSQSAVSAQIRQIESEYGERLLDRSGKTVRLTPAGEVFREYAQRMLSLRDESLRAVADHGNDPRDILLCLRSELHNVVVKEHDVSDAVARAASDGQRVCVLPLGPLTVASPA